MSDGQAHAEKIAAKALDTVEDKGPDWIARLVASAEKKAAEQFPDDETGKPDERRKVVLAALEPFRSEPVRQALARQGRDRLARILVAVHAGRDVGVAAYEELERASPRELLAALDASTDRVIAAAVQRIEDGKAIRDALVFAGLGALKLLVPLLIAAL